MKEIVVPTDFSSSAENAMLYAAGLAQETNSTLVLLHVYQMPVTMTDMPVMMVSVEDLKKTADHGLSQAKKTLKTSYPDIEVIVESRLGNIEDEINGFSEERNPLIIVLGKKDVSGFEKLLFGNTVFSIIRSSTTPVLSVPANAKKTTPKNIVLATDLQDIDQVPAQEIIEIVNLFGARLHIVHIENKESDNDNTKASEELMNRLQYVSPVFHTATDNDVTEGLKNYVQANNIDLLLVLPHKHNLYERLFFNLHTEGLIENLPVPVLSLKNKSD